MAKPTGFKEYKRKDPGYRPKAARLKDYQEVEKTLSSSDITTQAARCMDCGTPFCHGAGCPLANIIPDINDLVYNDRWQEALDLILATNNFPEFTGRICPALCEAACVLGLVDEPVTIRLIEREVIEGGFKEGWVKPIIPEQRSGKKVAVIGSGPAGLAAAEELNKAGHLVTVYEKDLKPGGILRYGIPDFKLDKSIVDRRVRLMKESGISFENNVAIGEEISGSFLTKRYDAICLTGGAREPRDLNVPGRDLKGIHLALDYLIQQNQRVAREKVTGPQILAKGKHVAVIGGGDTGSDCVGTANRQGAKSVTQLEILPKPPDKRPESTPWPAWPLILRTSSSHKEGCARKWSVSTVAFEGTAGKLKGLTGTKVKWKADKPNGRPHPEPVPKTEFKLKCDLVLLAMGFTGPEDNVLFKQLGVKRDRRGGIVTDDNFMTSRKGVFTAGDMNTGATLVVRTINQGRMAAERLNKYLMQKRRK